jgi:aminopeptidase-like protein
LPQTGYDIYNLAGELFPICRSITGDGTRETLRVLRRVCPAIKIHEVPSGTRAFDWTVPKEWNVRDAYIECPDGERIAEFRKNNLHLMGYSVPVDKTMPLGELQQHLYSLPEQPKAIPYVTSYYEERFGFCIAHEDRERLTRGDYRVFIDSELKNGSLTYGEAIIPGGTEREIFFSAYICHPSMANNELSGPCLAAYLAAWIASLDGRRYTYRIVFIPETIGSIVYLSRNLETMKRRVIAGFNLTCLGDPGNFSVLASRYGDTMADRAAKSVLGDICPDYKTYSILSRGSDERQYCAPGVDLPLCCLMRTKFGIYPEYHTSEDNMDFITPAALDESFGMLRALVEALEANGTYEVKTVCEPQLSPRGLYPSVSDKRSGGTVRTMMNFIAYCDGKNDLFGISEIIGVPVSKLIPLAEKLEGAGVISLKEK